MKNYEVEKEKLNDFYESISVGIFPFISKNRVTILKQGLYKKLNSKYHGVTMRNDKTDTVRCYLMGYYFVPENYLIVPDMELNDKHKALIGNYLDKKFKLVNNPPSLSFYEFTKNTKEWEIADYFYKNYNKIKNDNFNNKQDQSISSITL